MLIGLDYKIHHYNTVIDSNPLVTLFITTTNIPASHCEWPGGVKVGWV